MTASRQYEPTEIDLSGTQYTVEQTGRDENFRPEYEARDAAGDTIFRTTYQMYEGTDEFPFVDADGTEICRVEAVDTWDIAGDYLLTDSQTGDDLVILDNDFSLLQDTWRVRDAGDELRQRPIGVGHRPDVRVRLLGDRDPGRLLDVGDHEEVGRVDPGLPKRRRGDGAVDSGDCGTGGLERAGEVVVVRAGDDGADGVGRHRHSYSIVAGGLWVTS